MAAVVLGLVLCGIGHAHTRKLAEPRQTMVARHRPRAVFQATFSVSSVSVVAQLSQDELHSPVATVAVRHSVHHFAVSPGLSLASAVASFARRIALFSDGHHSVSARLADVVRDETSLATLSVGGSQVLESQIVHVLEHSKPIFRVHSRNRSRDRLANIDVIIFPRRDVSLLHADCFALREHLVRLFVDLQTSSMLVGHSAPANGKCNVAPFIVALKHIRIVKADVVHREIISFGINRQDRLLATHQLNDMPIGKHALPPELDRHSPAESELRSEDDHPMVIVEELCAKVILGLVQRVDDHFASSRVNQHHFVFDRVGVLRLIGIVNRERLEDSQVVSTLLRAGN
jgi:hypothetical protein